MRPWIREVPTAEWKMIQRDHDPGELPRPWETVHGSQVAPRFAGISTHHMQRSLSALGEWTTNQAAGIRERFSDAVFMAVKSSEQKQKQHTAQRQACSRQLVATVDGSSK